MNEVPSNLSVFLTLADFASIDDVHRAKKVSMVGGAKHQLAPRPDAEGTYPFTLFAATRGHGSGWGNEEFSFEIVLKHADGAPVSLPGPDGSDQVLRFGQNRTFPWPPNKETQVVEDLLTITFDQGLPITPGVTYYWEASINGETDPRWSTYFSVAAPMSPPTLG